MRAQLLTSTAPVAPESEAPTADEALDYDKLLLDTKDACAFVKRERGIKLSPSTLASRVTRGGGPPFLKARFNGMRYYRASSLLAWIDEQCGDERTSSSAAV